MTAVALYSLLVARESLGDDPDYSQKLDPNGPELKPALRWTVDSPTDATYAVGYKSAALSLALQMAENKEKEPI